MAGSALAGVSMLAMVPAAGQARESQGQPVRGSRAVVERSANILAYDASAAGAGERVALTIPAGSLEAALVAFSEQTGVKLVYATDLTARLTTAGVAGAFEPRDGLERILAGTDLSFRTAGTSTITLVNPRYVQLGAATAGAVALEELHVAGQGQAPGLVSGLPPRSGTVGQPPVPYAGGQVGTGTRVGLLGNRSVLKTPFNVTGYTEKLIENQQARSVGDVVLNNPSVRSDAPPTANAIRTSFAASR